MNMMPVEFDEKTRDQASEKNMGLKKNRTISKGYRLSATTHKMIFKIKKMLNVNYDVTLRRLCEEYMKNNSKIQYTIKERK